jgi:hypothetical protein
METSDVLDRQYSIRLYDSLPPMDVMCSVASYMNNGTLAVQLFNKPDLPDGFPIPSDPRKIFCEPYGVVTVNLFESGLLPYNVQFVDENNLPGIGEWLKKNGIAQPTGIYSQSGYCMYEAYAFNLSQKDLKEVMSRRQELGCMPQLEQKSGNSIKVK